MGRPKGSPNQDTKKIQELAQKLGVDPFEILLRFAAGDWKGLGYPAGTHHVVTRKGGIMEEEIITPQDRLKAACECAQYLYPKRRAVEFENLAEGIQHVTITMADYLTALKKDPLLVE